MAIPEWIKNGDLEIKRTFLQALFDDESTVSVNSREIVLNMKKVENLKGNLEQFFEDLKEMLLEFGIDGVTITECHPHEGKNGKTIEKRLRICGTFNFIEFGDKINFVNINKREKLASLIKNTEHFQLRNGEGKRKIIGLLSEEDKMNTVEIAKSIGISSRSAWNHLQTLQKKNIVSRIKPTGVNRAHIWILNSKFTNNVKMVGEITRTGIKDLKSGSFVIIEDAPCRVEKVQVSTSGKDCQTIA